MFIPIYFLILLVILIITLSISLASDKEKRYYDFILRSHSVFKLKDDEFLNSIKINHTKWRSRNFKILLTVSFLIFLYFVYFVFFNSFNFIVGDI